METVCGVGKMGVLVPGTQGIEISSMVVKFGRLIILNQMESEYFIDEDKEVNLLFISVKIS